MSTETKYSHILLVDSVGHVGDLFMNLDHFVQLVSVLSLLKRASVIVN